MGLDVARGCALLGVVTMNYVAVLNARHAPWSRLEPRWLGWLLNPFRGPLTTRFALVFVVVAGMSFTLMAKRSSDHRGLRNSIAGRAALLFLLGVSFAQIWAGEILHSYALYMAIGLLMLDAPARWLAALGVAATVAAAVIQLWARDRYGALVRPHWLLPGQLHSGSHLTGDLFAVGTHPVTPWVGFFALGMWLGRQRVHDPRVRARLAARGGVVFVLALLAQQLGLAMVPDRWDWALSAGPYPPMPLYVIASCGLATLIVMGILEGSARWRGAPLDWLAAAGRCSLSLYLLRTRLP